MAADKKTKKKQKEKPPIPIPKPPIIFQPPPDKVYAADKVRACVVSAPNPPTTNQIAKGTGLPHKKVYNICQNFKKKGDFEKDIKPREKPLFFSPIIHQIMHAGNFNLINKLNKELPIIIEKYELKDPQMETALHKFFKTILRQYPYYHNSIVSGMKNLIRTIKRAKTKEDAISSLGLRKFHPKVCTWKSIS